MSNDKMREEFEAAAKIKWPNIRALRVNRPSSPIDGEYETSGLESAWWAWQASREALVIELPGQLSKIAADLPNAWQDGGSEMRARCQNVIEAAGLKVKP